MKSPTLKTAALAALFLCACAVTTLGAGAQAKGARRGDGGRAPRFEDYPVRGVYRGPVAPVRLDGRRARMYRTALGEGGRKGPNFAGRYTVVSWGCGTGCAQMGVVDAKTGRVYFPPVDYMDIPDLEDEAARGRLFRLDSKLLRITQNYHDAAGRYTAYYFLFDNNRFRLLRKAAERRPEPPGGREDRELRRQ